MTKAKTKANPAAAKKPMFRLGVQEIKAMVDSGELLSKQVAFDELNRRVQNRLAHKQPLFPHVAAYRNELAKALGRSDMVPEDPTYPAKKTAALNVSGDEAAAAASLVGMGYDPAKLIAELTKTAIASQPARA